MSASPPDPLDAEAFLVFLFGVTDGAESSWEPAAPSPPDELPDALLPPEVVRGGIDLFLFAFLW